MTKLLVNHFIYCAHPVQFLKSAKVSAANRKYFDGCMASGGKVCAVVFCGAKPGRSPVFGEKADGEWPFSVCTETCIAAFC